MGEQIVSHVTARSRRGTVSMCSKIAMGVSTRMLLEISKEEALELI